MSTASASLASDHHSAAGKRPAVGRVLVWVAAATVGVAGAYALSRLNYLLFHGIIESFRAVAAFCIFAIAWSSRRFLKAGNVWFLGLSFACTGVVVLLHMLAYKGMGVFAGQDTDLPTQLWVASRWVVAVAFVVTAFADGREFPVGPSLVAVLGTTAALVASIVVWDVFPTCYVEGVGLTPFKRGSELAAMALFAMAYAGFRRDGHSPRLMRPLLLKGAVIGNLLGSLAFSLYVDVYGVFNFAGHIAVAVADAFVLAAFVRSGVIRPQELVFWTIEQDRQALATAVERQGVELLTAEAELEQGHAELMDTRQALDAVRAREDGILATVEEAILCLDPMGRITFANPAALRLLGGDGRVGQMLPPVLAQVPLVAAVLAGGPCPTGGNGNCDVPLPAEDGSPRTVEVNVRPLPPVAGDAAVLVVRDVTGRRTMAEQQARHAEAMRRSLFETIGIVAQMVTARDPYTAGHQRRVADLAAAIARAMGMDEDSVTGIFLAGQVHDIGKISIPAEMLNRPGRLSPLEYELMKTHVLAGYDILKHADLAWPIATMIAQHHEKLDGSGYPYGLKGDAIVPGARILAVADIIEAMASHRPYRAALGIDAALAEVERQAGVTLDADVVAACLALFRSGRYQLPDTASFGDAPPVLRLQPGPVPGSVEQKG